MLDAPPATFVPVDHVQDARKLKKSNQSFYTPQCVVDLMIDDLGLGQGVRALEPSAGDGRIVWALKQRGFAVDVCEVNDAMRERCESLGAHIVGSDFLRYAPAEPYNLIVMNPPFARGQDRRHVERAYSILADGGKLVAITSPGFAVYLQNGTANLPGCTYAAYERLGKNTFKESGTAINTLLVTIERGAWAEVEGFRNQPTYNAALTIATDQALSNKASGVDDAATCRCRFGKVIAEAGGSVYGVDWAEVLDYLRQDENEVGR